MRYTRAWMMILAVVAMSANVEVLWARGGGRGGGGRGGGGFSGGGFGGGHGNVSRGGTPNRGGNSGNFNRSSASRPQQSRPSTGARSPGGQRPGGAGFGENRPGATPGSRPGSVQFPSAGRGGANRFGENRPGENPGVGRPGFNNGPGAGAPGVGVRPGNEGGTGRLPGLGNRPEGIGNRPATDGNRPGNAPDRQGDRQGNRDTRQGDRQGDRQTNQGDRQGNRQTNQDDRQGNRQTNQDDRQGNRQGNHEQRQQNLQNQMSGRQDNRNNRQDNRQDWNHWNNNYWHGGWHHGYWHGNWYGNRYWNNYPGAVALGMTAWGINRVAYGFGYWGYANPYAVAAVPVANNTYIDYSQPLMPTQTADASTDSGNSPAPGENDTPPAGIESFNAARTAFQQGDYPQALSLVNQTLVSMPDDPVVHEFRSLVLFAQQKYQDSAAAIYAVLAAGPGWDWTTMSSLYPSIDVYTAQLRSLESYCKVHPDAADSSFLLAYHYLTCGYTDAAVGQLKKVVKLQPQDRVAKELLQMAGGSAPAAGPAPTPGDGVDESASRDVPQIAMSQLAGRWSATGADKTRFDLQLSEKGEFTWTHTIAGQKPESVQGVYAIDGDSLAMQPDTGGTLLAKVTPPANGSFHFAIVGGPDVDPGLDFRKK